MPVLRLIFLLSPIFVSMFWAVVLTRDKEKQCEPRLFLSKFMFLVSLIFTSHFLYFAPLPDVYVFFDIPLQIAGSIIFPLYHIYFRLLTVDGKFSLRKHFRYYFFPLAVGLFYGIAVMLTPMSDYKLWLYHELGLQSAHSVQLLTIARQLIKFTFITTLVITMVSNYRLMKKYGHKAEQFYSDIQDARQKNAKRIYYSFLLIGSVSLVIILIGRMLLIPNDWIIFAGWIMFTLLIFVLGDSGMKQKMVNPSLEKVQNKEMPAELSPLLSLRDSNELLEKITNEFIYNKLHLNSELTILDLCKAIGSNRTYISAVINQSFNLNFCSFVNSYRIEELRYILHDHPEYTNEELAELCGFGSASSMKRALMSRSGETLKDFKRSTIGAQSVEELNMRTNLVL